MVPYWFMITYSALSCLAGVVVTSIMDSRRITQARESALSTITLYEEQMRTLRGLLVAAGDWQAVAAYDQSLEEAAKMRETIERVIA